MFRLDIRAEHRNLRRSGIAATALLAVAAGVGQGAQAQQAEAALDEQLHCLALAMYFEARTEGPEGMRAVGWVVLNRIAHDEFPATPCEVVRQGGETPPCQ